MDTTKKGSGMKTKALIMMLLMSCVAIATPQLKPTQRLADHYTQNVNLEAAFPKQIADWQAIDEGVGLVNPETATAMKKIYAQTLSRTYENRQGQRVMLSLAYGKDQSDEVGVHLPEGCYSGQGFRVDTKQSLVWAIRQQPVFVTKLMASRGDRLEPITYWLRTGAHVVKPGWPTKWVKMQYAFQGQIPDGMLVRVSSLVADTTTSSIDQAYALQEDFMLKLATNTQSEIQQWLLGQDSAAQ